MAKPGFNKNRMYLTAMMLFLLVSLLLGFTIYNIVENSIKLIEVPKTREPIQKGEEITRDNIIYAKQSRTGLDENVIVRAEDIIGKYALRDYGANENFFASSVTDNYLRSIQEKARYGGMAVSANMLQTANGEIKENDFVKIIVISPTNNESNDQVIISDNGEVLPSPNTKLVFSSELSAVRVLGLYSSTGESVQSSKDLMLSGEGKDVKMVQPSQVILDLLPKQQAMLLKAEYGGSIHMVILPKEIQDKYRKLWGLIDKEKVDLTIKGQEQYQNSLEELENSHYELDKKINNNLSDEEKLITEGEEEMEEQSETENNNELKTDVEETPIQERGEE